MNQITVKQWEEGYKLPDDNYLPDWDYFPTFGWILIGFHGAKTGIVLQRQFADILENESGHREGDHD